MTLGDAVLAFAARIEAGMTWDAFQREIRRGPVRAAWDALAAGTGLTGRDMLAAFAFAFYLNETVHRELEADTEAGGSGGAGGGDAVAEVNEAIGRAARAWLAAPESAAARTEYAVALAAWKVVDREATLKRLATLYWEYELAFDLTYNDLPAEERAYYAQELKMRQVELMRVMVRIDGGAYFRGFLPIAVPADVAREVYTTLERAFWRRIKEDLAAEPPVYDSLLPVLTELCELVERLAPSGRREWASRVAWFSDVMDTAFIRERLGREPGGRLAFDFWRERCSAALEMLIELDSAAAETEHRRWAAEHPVGGVDAAAVAAAVDVLAYVLRRLTEIRRLKEAMAAAETDTAAEAMGADAA